MTEPPQYPAGPFEADASYDEERREEHIAYVRFKLALTALGHYAWHGRHHTAQIHWVRRERLGLPD